MDKIRIAIIWAYLKQSFMSKKRNWGFPHKILICRNVDQLFHLPIRDDSSFLKYRYSLIYGHNNLKF